LRQQSRHLIITLPVYKDTTFLDATSALLEEATKAIDENFTLLVAEDGSNSSAAVNELKSKYSNIVHFQHDQRLGRGRALREAWNKVQGDTYVYVDVDLATDLSRFDAYRNLIEMQDRFDLVTGSRYIPGSITNRPWLRRVASKLYNRLVCILFRTGVHDHQCGFKSFSRQLVERLAVDARSNSWFWDTEVIVLAKKMGFGIKEIPIFWTEKKGAKTPIRRLASDVWLHGSGMLTLFYRVYLSNWGRNLS
jgi:hypothetical protein